MPGGVACQLSDNICGEAKDAVLNFESQMLLNSEEIAGRQERGSALYYLVPVFRNSKSKYEDFFFDLHCRNLVEFSAHVHCVNGLFFVAKKGGRLRMILDARPANDHFRTPPSSTYSSGASFASLRIPADKVLYSAQYDVKEFFYRLRIPTSLAKWFGLPCVRRAALKERFGTVKFKHIPNHTQYLYPYFFCSTDGVFVGAVSRPGMP